MTQLHILEDKSALAKAYAEWMYRDIMMSSGSYHISLSGGSTPKALFDILAAQYSNLIPWHRVHLWWGDERCVPPDHEESNYGMTYARLISGVEIPPLMFTESKEKMSLKRRL